MLPMTKEQLEQHLDELIRKGLVQEIRYTKDSEPVYQLTPEGKKILEEAHQDD